jgi:glutamate formiminotransferase/formiminotetrahydrofolate cyclodeaminase
MRTLVECVPNFSEGNDRGIIDQITSAIENVEGITLLDVDPGKETNRTVVTFVGSIAAVEEAAFQGIAKAAELIDMSKQKGAHPRMGATDVCPFIPVSNVTTEDCTELAKRVGQRVGEKLAIPVYLYEHSAQEPKRKNLANIRSGEYEGLANKLKDPEWKPDFGKAEFNSTAGATVMGARDFLIAYNINLNTRDKRIATDIAFELREKGRSKRVPLPESTNHLDGPIVRYKANTFPCGICDEIFKTVDELLVHTQSKHDYDMIPLWSSYGYSKDKLVGKAVKKPGQFQGVKAIGWFIDTFNRAQISINFTDFKQSTIHEVFDSACELANQRGVRVTGSELVGLIPLDAILMAGRYFLKKQNQTTGIPTKDIIECAIQSLGLNDVAPFIIQEKIIEFAVSTNTDNLVGLSVTDFNDELSSNSPAPGGGSVSALAASLGASLASMVAALTHEKKGFLDKKPMLNEVGVKTQELKERLTFLVDEDTNAFNMVMAANRLPSGSKSEEEQKLKAVQSANRYAIEVPLEVAKLSLEVMKLAQKMVEEGNPNSVSDAGVGAEVAYAGLRGACLNVLINISGMDDDEDFVEKAKDEVEKLLSSSKILHQMIFAKTVEIIGK